MKKNSIVVLGPPPGEPREEISIIIPPKPGEEDGYYASGNVSTMKYMDVCSMSIANIGQEADLPSSKLPFTLKLYEMLEHVSETGQTDIVSWVGNGKAFKVHDMDRFVNEVIPIYFKQSKYKSFQRQLYFYGFTRQTKGPMDGSYFHPNFRRDKKTLCLSMTTKKAASRYVAAAKVAEEKRKESLVPGSHDAPEETVRRVSLARDWIVRTGDGYDQTTWNTETEDSSRRTTTPSPALTLTTGARSTSMVPRVSMVCDETGNTRSSSYWHRRNDDFNPPNRRRYDGHDHNGQDHDRTHHQQAVFAANEGHTCCVFDGMTFHDVDHV